MGALGTQSASAARLEGDVPHVPGSNSIPTVNAGQVDALGNILENLGSQPNGRRLVNVVVVRGLRRQEQQVELRGKILLLLEDTLLILELVPIMYI